MQPRVHKSEEGRLLNVLGNPMLEKAGPRDFDGHAAVFALTVLPGGGPPPHYHEGVDEFFYVLDGELDFACPGHRCACGEAELDEGGALVLGRKKPGR